MRTLSFLPRAPLYTATTLVLGLLASASALAAQATASSARVAGEAIIEPVASNLAAKPWVSVRVSSGDESAERARDGDESTAWRPEGEGEWLLLDLGGAYDNIRRVELVFSGAGDDYRYLIEASSDGRDWDVVADRSGAPLATRGAAHLMTRRDTRYLRATLLGARPAAVQGIAEVRAFNYLRDDLVLGADLSFLDDHRNRNYFVSPDPSLQDMGAGPHLLDVVQDRGMEFIRLRVFNEPRNERSGELRTPATQGPERTLQSARLVKERGLQLGVDFHYADSWADPGKQPKPRAWAELDFDSLTAALHEFTYDYLRRLVEQGTTPDKVAIGNEIINGFLWGSESAPLIEAAGPDATVNPPYFRDQAVIYQSQPGGRILWEYWNSDDPAERLLYEEGWDRFATLVAAGVSAARAASPETRVELHTIVGMGTAGEPGIAKTLEFWDQLLTRLNARGQDPDVLAISYYPEWHGTVEQLDMNLHAIATAHPQYALNIAETAYPATGGTPQPNAVYPRTVQGQADAIQRVFQAANDVVDNRGVGVLLWEPASFQSMFRPVVGMENYYEPLASIDVFNRSHAEHIPEGPVYVAARAGEAASLPAAVNVLSTADGAVRSVPVDWEDERRPVSGAAGRFEVRGITPFGAVTAIVDPVAR